MAISVLSASSDSGLAHSRDLLLLNHECEVRTSLSKSHAQELIQSHAFDVLVFGNSLTRDVCQELAKDFRARNRQGKIIEQRWGKNFSWHNRALDFDEHSDSELQRKLLAHRVRVRQRALDIADKIDQKLVEAVDALKVTKVVKTEGKPDEMQLQVSPAEIGRLFEVSQKIQNAILGDGSEDRVAAIHVHFDAYNEEYDYEQPEAMAETRRKALEARQPLSD